MTFEFLADRPALDFVPTVAQRGSTREELLRTPEDLIHWVRESGIVEDLTEVTPSQLDEAKAVREAIFGLVTALIDGTTPSAAQRIFVNRAAAKPRPVLNLDDHGRVQRSGGLEALLASLACDCLELFDSPDRATLRWCADSFCTRPFIDRSHGQRRRWCGMRGCGDRAKAAAYRRRQQRPSG